MKKEILIPADVPQNMRDEFVKNYNAITKNTGNLFMFAADRKIEFLNEDFYGPDIAPAAGNPKHLFEIAQKGNIGAMETEVGLLIRYATEFPDVTYIARLNSKTNLSPKEEYPPISWKLWPVERIMTIKKNSNLNICAINYTIYLGSHYEWHMLPHSAEAIFNAHQQGLVTIVSIYPQGKEVKEERIPKIIAGAAGVAPCLGADFVRVHPPETQGGQSSEELLKQATQAAGNTKVICSGGPTQKAENFLDQLYKQIQIGGTSGAGVGRNIFQKPLDQAVKMTKAIAAIVYEGKTADEAKKLL